ncbi:hypothetical protein E4S40_06800 [Algoriphagus kandeliae]|uniref:Lipoprotein n=1 Tax=Algoriphagus kandeliae TaxID=2562278 RepID=A0A4Y9QXK6_9BACT|nr:hypothetical protein [Algoriphagus kandeliae]TFV95926.1 hypothetical protein E4S40_06800 [Algoriphagus kandeliae]
MKNLNVLMIILLFYSCDEKKTGTPPTSPPLNIQNELVIIFDRNNRNTIIASFRNDFTKDFYFVRENFDPPFDDPNLNIKVFHGIDHQNKLISRKELERMNVWFDSEMDYMDWFSLSFDKYYIIYQDEYLVKGSLKPEFEFTAYEVNIYTGGIE